MGEVGVEAPRAAPGPPAQGHAEGRGQVCVRDRTCRLCVPGAASVAVRGRRSWGPGPRTTGRCPGSAQAVSSHFHLHSAPQPCCLPSPPSTSPHPNAGSPAQAVEIKKGTDDDEGSNSNPSARRWRLGSGWLCGRRGHCGGFCPLPRLALSWAHPTHSPAAGAETQQPSEARWVQGDQLGSEPSICAEGSSRLAAGGRPSVDASPWSLVPPEHERTPALAPSFSGGVFQGGTGDLTSGAGRPGLGDIASPLLSLPFFFHWFIHRCVCPQCWLGVREAGASAVRSAQPASPPPAATPLTQTPGAGGSDTAVVWGRGSVDTRVLTWHDLDLQRLETFGVVAAGQWVVAGRCSAAAGPGTE